MIISKELDKHQFVKFVNVYFIIRSLKYYDIIFIRVHGGSKMGVGTGVS